MAEKQAVLHAQKGQKLTHGPLRAGQDIWYIRRKTHLRGSSRRCRKRCRAEKTRKVEKTRRLILWQSFYEAAAGGGRPFRTSDPSLETRRGAVHLHRTSTASIFIDLQKTVRKIDEAYMFVRDLAIEESPCCSSVTKKQAQESIETEAKRCGNVLCTTTVWWAARSPTSAPSAPASTA